MLEIPPPALRCNIKTEAKLEGMRVEGLHKELSTLTAGDDDSEMPSGTLELHETPRLRAVLSSTAPAHGSHKYLVSKSTPLPLRKHRHRPTTQMQKTAQKTEHKRKRAMKAEPRLSQWEACSKHAAAKRVT